MKILVTGNLGYIGSVLCEMLLEKKYFVVGLDTNYYSDCLLFSPITKVQKQTIKDVRDVTNKDLEEIDAIIHLAALSNDPLGELDSNLTDEINYQATIKLAQLAKKTGVRRFIYASSQSMYGLSKIDKELDEDKSEKNPLTVYASTKWKAECELKELGSPDFHIVCFRPSTVFGASPMLRCDIVFNNMVGCAFTTGKIEIKSDGSPWRPVVHVRDVSNAFIAGLEAPENLVSGQSFNVGIPNGNFSVKDLAEAAHRAVPSSTLVYTGEHKDSRSYKVSFKKILSTLNKYYKPEWDLDRGGKELVNLFKKINFSQSDFYGKKCNRLQQINYLIKEKKLDSHLRWTK